MEGASVDPLANVSVLVGSWAQLFQRYSLGAAVEPLNSHTRTDAQKRSLAEKKTSTDDGFLDNYHLLVDTSYFATRQLKNWQGAKFGGLPMHHQTKSTIAFPAIQ